MSLLSLRNRRFRRRKTRRGSTAGEAAQLIKPTLRRPGSGSAGSIALADPRRRGVKANWALRKTSAPLCLGVGASRSKLGVTSLTPHSPSLPPAAPPPTCAILPGVGRRDVVLGQNGSRL